MKIQKQLFSGPQAELGEAQRKILFPQNDFIY